VPQKMILRLLVVGAGLGLGLGLGVSSPASQRLFEPLNKNHLCSYVVM
jgi:hypothetical protein